MPAKIGIIAALPREIARLVKGIKPDADLLRDEVWLYRLEGAVVVAAGMGGERAVVAVEAALASGEVEVVVSTGLAGGCAAGIAAGTVLEASMVVDVRTGERFATSAGAGVTLATAETIASVGEKARLARDYGAALVDMEAAPVGRLALAKGLGFRAIKGVSDEYDFELGTLAEFEGERGCFRTGAFALHTALRPWTWGKAMTLGRGSAKALVALEAVLREVVTAE
ncbi:MAG: phosphorylase [Acidobacteriaceae bacterium]